MRDTTSITRPYFRESTDALASLAATRPARDVLLNIAAELTHRERPAARRLASEVAALLGGVASIAPVAPVVVAPMPAPVVAPVMEAAPILAKPARKPAAPKVKRPGDIGWRPRSLDQIARSAGVAPMGWEPDAVGIFGNVMKAAREFGLQARGWKRGETDRDGYTTWTMGDAGMRMGPFGALYCGTGTWVQVTRDERDAITEDGRAAVKAAVEAERLRAKRAKAKAQALLVRKMALDYRRNLKRDAPQYMKDARKQKMRQAWQARAAYRAIVA